MLTVGIVSLFPEMFDALDYGIPQRAQQQGCIKVQYWNPRDFSKDNYRSIDDRPYGGGPGMVMLYEPLTAAIHAAKAQLGQQTSVVYLSPQGRLINQQQVMTWSQAHSLILVSGRYEGIDERIIEQAVDEEWSIGEYVLSGGELPAMVVIDAIARLLPDAVGNAASVTNDSFAAGLLDHPQYTRPETIAEQRVPSVLLSGNHKAIERWRLKQRLGKTWLKRPDLLAQYPFNTEEQVLLEEFINEHNEFMQENQ